MLRSVIRVKNTVSESRALRSQHAYARRGLLVATVLAVVGLSAAPLAVAQVNVTTEQNDIGRTGQNLNETILTTANVNSTQFGLLFSQPVAGQVRAQPLYMSGLTINGALHNVVFVATLNGFVYAFDANSNTGANASPLWGISLLDTAHGAAPGATTYGNLGTMSTPVIDPIGNTLYVVSASFEGVAPIFRLHALDLASGAEKFLGPVLIAPSVPGTAPDAVGMIVPLTTRNHLSRTGLLLLNGVVYVTFGAYNEGYETIWHGWIVGFDATSLAQTGVFCATPNGTGGGYWMSGAGLAADQLDTVNHPFGRMFVPSGNGDFTAAPPYTSNMDYGDSILNLDLTNGMPAVTDDFTSYNQALLFPRDQDQGSAGLMIVPVQSTGPYPHLLVQTGKTGTLFLLNRDNLGGYNTTDQVVQSMPNAVGNNGAWSAPAYWNGNVYYWGKNDYLKSFPLVNGLLSATPTESVELSQYPGSTPLISANGNTQGIVWTINADAYASGGPAILEAHDASNVATTLYSSATNAARDTAGPASHFSLPTIANGMVYVGTQNQLDVYGLLSGTQTSTPVISPASRAFASSLSVTITDPTPNAAIYYTTDGTAPTTGSALYTGAITVSSSETINAVAVAPGSTLSSQAWASYSERPTAPPTFVTVADAYSGAQAVTITDATPGATIYYTTDGSAPTVGSAVYSGPITVSASETINAIALAPGYTIGGVASAPYTIATSSTLLVNDAAGFASASGLSLLGGALLTNNALQLSLAGGANNASAAWFATPVNIQTFTSDFYFSIQEISHIADGFTFTLQNSPAGLNALGGMNGGLGYQGIASSVAVKFDIFDNAGEGVDSTGFYTNGAAPTVPAVDMTSTVNLLGPDILHAHITYDGTTLTLTLIDTVSGLSFTTSSAMNIPAIIGGNTAYAGFTAGPGATQTILNWTYVGSSASTPATATPIFTPAPGTYGGAQSVTITDGTSGAVIYYTTDGTVPTTTTSPVYSSSSPPISVNTNETLKAIAVASGYTTSAVATAAYKIRAASPSFTPGAGTYTGPQSVTIADATSGAVIYYTTDGTVPSTTTSPVYSRSSPPVSVNANETLKAIAVASNYATSSVVTAVYNFQTAAPSVTPAAGTYPVAQSVTITDSTSGAVIYYTTDGSTPSTSSSVYSGAISVSSDQTVKAIAVASGNATSSVVTRLYNIRAAAPSFTPGAGTYPGTQSVTITDGTSGAVIYYTLDGSTPTTSSLVYSGPISVSASETLKAIAVASGYASSVVGTDAYKIQTATPSFTPAAGTYSGAQSVTITDATSGAVIYYTTDGSTPTTSSLVCSGAISVSADETLKAMAVASGYATSSVVTHVYNIQTAKPSFTPLAGTYSGQQSVTITDSTSGAVIYYTTDGSTPTTASLQYSSSSPISVSADETLKAIAVASGYATSAVVTAAFNIRTAAPTFSYPAGTYAGALSVSIADSTSGALIYYTTDGSTPTTASLQYSNSSPISVSANETLKAIAVASGYASSAVVTHVYIIQTAKPGFSPPAGTYIGGQPVTITDGTPGATIYYTIDGTVPTTTTSLPYSSSSPLFVSANETLKAIAVASGYATSGVTTAVYKIHN